MKDLSSFAASPQAVSSVISFKRTGNTHPRRGFLHAGARRAVRWSLQMTDAKNRKRPGYSDRLNGKRYGVPVWTGDFSGTR